MLKWIGAWFVNWLNSAHTRDIEQHLSTAKDHVDLKRLMNELKYTHRI